MYVQNELCVIVWKLTRLFRYPSLLLWIGSSMLQARVADASARAYALKRMIERGSGNRDW